MNKISKNSFFRKFILFKKFNVFLNEDMIEEAETCERASLWCHIRLGSNVSSCRIDVEGIIGIRNKMLHFMGYCEDESG